MLKREGTLIDQEIAGPIKSTNVGSSVVDLVNSIGKRGSSGKGASGLHQAPDGARSGKCCKICDQKFMMLALYNKHKEKVQDIDLRTKER